MKKTSINYTNRPHKTFVRTRILDVIESKFRPKHEHDADVSYVSLAGHMFIDSMEFYKRFNIRRIFSVENRQNRYMRALFNKPYQFIDVIEGDIKKFIDEKLPEVAETRKVIFLDYESTFIESIISDIKYVINSGILDRDTLLFIAFNRHFDRSKCSGLVLDVVPENIKNTEAFKNWLSDDFSGFIENQVRTQYGDEISIEQVIKYFYNDSTNMFVIGYHFSNSKEGVFMHKKIFPEKVVISDLTWLEANYIQNNLSNDTSEISSLIGISHSEIDAYKKHV